MEGKEVATGEEGELLVFGGSVMIGYWNRREQTEKSFSVDESGRPWYRTGDVVVDGGNGSLRFLGRRDRMVKRRGYRVELGEIESALYRHPQITEAATVALPDAESGVLIKAFLSWSGEAPPSMVELKKFCASNLPLYMVPDRFECLDGLPKTSTDKIDYQTSREAGLMDFTLSEEQKLLQRQYRPLCPERAERRAARTGPPHGVPARLVAQVRPDGPSGAAGARVLWRRRLRSLVRRDRPRGLRLRLPRRRPGVRGLRASSRLRRPDLEARERGSETAPACPASATGRSSP